MMNSALVESEVGIKSCENWILFGGTHASASQSIHWLVSKSIDKETIFDYKFDIETNQWMLWEAEAWVPPKRIQFSQLLIPTSDSTRAEFII
jgi:hypothetical protein